MNRLVTFSPYLFCVLVALCVCMMSPLNPLSSATPGTDSSVFLTIAKGMSNGDVPYRDYFDHKGPLLYFLNFTGWQFGETLGVWLIELISMSLSAIFAYKTLLLFMNQLSACIGMLFGFISLTPFFEGGNLTELYALAFIFVSLFFITKNIIEDSTLNSYVSIVCGFCFGSVMLLRPNMFAIWAAFCPVIFLLMISRKQYFQALKLIVLFFAGTLIIIIPIALYLYNNGILKDCIQQYILFNSRYATSELSATLFIQNIATTSTKHFSWIALAGSLFWFLSAKGRLRIFHGACLLSTLITILLIAWSSANYNHYSMTILPFMVLQIGFFANVLMNQLKMRGYFVATLCTAIIFSIAFLPAITEWEKNVSRIMKSSDENEMKLIASIIEGHAKPEDTFLVFGNNCQLYLYSDVPPASKYIYQLPIALVSNQIFSDLEKFMLSDPPKFVVLPINRANDIKPMYFIKGNL